VGGRGTQIEPPGPRPKGPIVQLPGHYAMPTSWALAGTDFMIRPRACRCLDATGQVADWRHL
jgi:hypothetical protein